MEAADKGLQGGASLHMDHHLDACEGDSVDAAQGNLFQETQRQPVDPHATPATQGLEAEGQQSTALLPVGLQGQVSAGQAREMQLEMGVQAPPHQKRAGVMLQPLWDRGEDSGPLGGMVQAHPQDREGSFHGQEPGKDGTQIPFWLPEPRHACPPRGPWTTSNHTEPSTAVNGAILVRPGWSQGPGFWPQLHFSQALCVGHATCPL